MSERDESVALTQTMAVSSPPQSRHQSGFFGRVKTSKLVECRIVQPDHTMYCLQVRRDCKGSDCLQAICDTLGILEMDYFGLQYRDKDSNYDVWLNNRQKVNTQLKTKPPYFLKFRVRYYTDADLILQPYTLTAFYLDLKCQIKRGDIHLPDQKKSLIAACMAQVDLGDASAHCSTHIGYPSYFPGWNGGVAYATTKEHEKLKGLGHFEAINKFLREVYLLDHCGLSRVRGWMDGKWVSVITGSRRIQILDDQHSCLERVSYASLTMVSFGNNFFGFNYHSIDDDGNSSEKMCKIVVRNYTIARSLFRSVTEEQVFFYQKTVPLQVANHVERRQKRLKRICSKVFRMKFEPTYYYDIARTKMEAYRHNWQLLHQVEEEEEEADIGPRSQVQSETPLIEELEVTDSNLSETVCHNAQKSEVYRGLSTTTCEIAKQLLPESQLHLSVSEDFLLGEGGTAVQSKDESAVSKQSLQPLSEAQGKKLRQLLLNIQDERMCQLCMDELTSAVFCPCGHNVACYKCARRVDKCPVCRHLIGHVQYVYGTS